MRSIRFGVAAIAICGVLAFGAGMRVAIWEGEVARTADRQEAIGDAIFELRNLTRALLDLETGQRGYLLTGDNAYLQPYEEGGRNLDLAVGKLRAMMAGDAARVATVAGLAELAAAKRQELAKTVALRRQGDLDAALAIVKTGEGKRLMDAFHDRSAALFASLRQERSDLVAHEARTFRWASLLGGVVLVLIMLLVGVAVGWLSFSMRRERELQQRSEREAMHDALTGLPNRRYLREWLEMTLPAARRGGHRLVLLYFDLDGFKAVNDRLGHEAGDRVLQATATRLRSAVRSSDFVSRLGGDEFVAVLPEAPAEPDLAALIERVSEELRRASIPELADGDVSASIGVASYPADGADCDALLGAADRAMYAAKQRRHGGLASRSRQPDRLGAPAAT